MGELKKNFASLGQKVYFEFFAGIQILTLHFSYEKKWLLERCLDLEVLIGIQEFVKGLL